MKNENSPQNFSFKNVNVDRNIQNITKKLNFPNTKQINIMKNRLTEPYQNNKINVANEIYTKTKNHKNVGMSTIDNNNNNNFTSTYNKLLNNICVKDIKDIESPNKKINKAKRKKRPIKPGPVKPGTLKNKSIESEDGKKGIYAVPVTVSYRTWSQEDSDGNVWHIVRIFSDKDINNAIIHLFAVDEEGKKMGLNIEEAEGYDIREGEEFVDSTDFDDADDYSESSTKQVKNAISGVDIQANIAKTLKVRFNSNLKYSLSIDSDQIEEINEK